MTALVGGEVKRTLSAVGRQGRSVGDFLGRAATMPHHAGGEDLAELVEVGWEVILSDSGSGVHGWKNAAPNRIFQQRQHVVEKDRERKYQQQVVLLERQQQGRAGFRLTLRGSYRSTSTLSTLLRHTPHDLLQRYFEQFGLSLPLDFVDASPRARGEKLLGIIEAQVSGRALQQTLRDFERMHDMAADDGDTAVVSATQRLEKSDPHNFGSLRNAHARAIFLWLQSRKSFETAEHIR